MKFAAFFILTLAGICNGQSGPGHRKPIGVSHGHEMSMVKGPARFIMGSPAGEAGRTDDEIQHEVIINRNFAIGTKEVTVTQFQAFLEANPSVKTAAKVDSLKSPTSDNKRLLKFSPEPDCPQIYVTWYEAAEYCNWLSLLEGIPEREWCYVPVAGGMIIPKDQLRRKGYRLPTEAEWEYAARGGKTTTWYFGNDVELLSGHAWYSKNPPMKKTEPNDPNDPQHTYPVGKLKPNPFGLFDMYGNVWEWCNSVREPYKTGNVEDEVLGEILVTDAVPMVRRGGSFAYSKDEMRSAHRGALNYFPNQRRDNVGFRVAKTVNQP